MVNNMGVGQPGGFVDEFDANGNFIKRIATMGALNAPWGITLAPGRFGQFSNDLLIGQFGDGEILAYDPTTDRFLGTVDGKNQVRLERGHCGVKRGLTPDRRPAAFKRAEIKAARRRSCGIRPR